MDAVQKANAGHPGTAMALAPLAYVSTGACSGTTRPTRAGRNRDRFVLSAGHAAMLQYAVLHLTGYNLSLEELEAVPPVAVEDARAPGALPHRGRRDDDRAARPGVRERRRLRDRRPLPRQRYNRPHA